MHHAQWLCADDYWRVGHDTSDAFGGEVFTTLLKFPPLARQLAYVGPDNQLTPQWVAFVVWTVRRVAMTRGQSNTAPPCAVPLALLMRFQGSL